MTEDILDPALPFLNQCGSCDAGLPMNCTCPEGDYRPVMLDLVREVERLRAGTQDEIRGARAGVAGAVANLLRATDRTDPAYDGVRRAYGVALEAAGLVPEETP
jgi:hypothetical protein